MRRALRIFTFMLALPFIGFGIYDLAAFQSRRASIEQKIVKATPDERNPSPTLKRLILISMHGRTADFTARVLIQELKIPLIIHGALGWHATNALWSKLMALHVSEDEQLAIIISLSYMGGGHYGFSAGSASRFDRRLSELSLDELAALVVIAHAPFLHWASPEILSARKEWLIRAFNNDS